MKTIFGRKFGPLNTFLIIFILLLGALLVPHPGWCLSEEGEILLARGNKLYLDGKYAEARETLSRAAQLKPQDPEIWALLGVTHLALKEYPQAKEAYTKAINLDPRISRGKLYLGVANYFLGNYREAERWLGEAKAEAPEDGLVHYYLGLCATRQNRPKEALTELEMGMNLSPQFALGFKGYQEAAQSYAKEARPFQVSLTTGIEYDDNAKVLPDNTTLAIVKTKGHKADWRTPIIINANYQPIVKDNWTLGLRYYSYNGLNYYLDNFNVFDQLGEVYLKYQIKRLIIQPFYAFDYTWLGGNPYSMFNSAGLRLTLMETPYLNGDLVYMFQDREFKYPVSQPYDRTGNLNQVGFFQTLTGKKGSLRLGFIWERELTTGINFTSQRYRIPVEAYYLLPWQIVAYGYFEYARTAANNRDTAANKLRRDDYYQVVFQLRRPVTSWMNVIAGYSHISNPSNINDYQYERNIYQLLVQFYY